MSLRKKATSKPAKSRSTNQRKSGTVKAGARTSALSDAREQRVRVRKTYKLLIGGAFVRSESEREYPIYGASQEVVAHVCRGTRKDIRNAVVAARKALESWKQRTPYNRAQILYRIAEMLEARRTQFEQELQELGATPSAAVAEVNASIDCCVHYAGWADKFQQVLGSINPVAGNFFNFSCAEPIGVVGALVPETPALLGLLRAVLPLICVGNTSVVIVSETGATVGLSFAEVLVSSDVPGGVVNLISGHRDELVQPLAAHMDIGAVLMPSGDSTHLASVRANGVENLKRIIALSDTTDSLSQLERAVEIKTTWHPVAV